MNNYVISIPTNIFNWNFICLFVKVIITCKVEYDKDKDKNINKLQVTGLTNGKIIQIMLPKEEETKLTKEWIN